MNTRTLTVTVDATGLENARRLVESKFGGRLLEHEVLTKSQQAYLVGTLAKLPATDAEPVLEVLYDELPRHGRVSDGVFLSALQCAIDVVTRRVRIEDDLGPIPKITPEMTVREAAEAYRRRLSARVISPEPLPPERQARVKDYYRRQPKSEQARASEEIDRNTEDPAERYWWRLIGVTNRQELAQWERENPERPAEHRHWQALMGKKPMESRQRLSRRLG